VIEITTMNEKHFAVKKVQQEFYYQQVLLISFCSGELQAYKVLN